MCYVIISINHLDSKRSIIRGYSINLRMKERKINIRKFNYFRFCDYFLVSVLVDVFVKVRVL